MRRSSPRLGELDILDSTADVPGQLLGDFEPSDPLPLEFWLAPWAVDDGEGRAILTRLSGLQWRWSIRTALLFRAGSGWALSVSESAEHAFFLALLALGVRWPSNKMIT